MAKNREMLKEAIAEAKAVKEMAIANAKVALEEAFTPQLKNMLSLKLQEMEDEDSKKSMEEMKYEEDDDKSMKEEKMYDEDDSKESMEEEVNLDELLAELEEDASLEEGKEEDETVDENISEDEDMEVEDEESETEEVEGEPLDLEDMTDEDLKSMIEDVISDMVKSGELEAGEEEMGDDADVMDMDMDMDMDSEEEELEEEINLSELLKEIEDLKEEEIVSERKKGKKEEKSEKEDKKKKSEKEDKDLKEDLNKKLEEAYSAIKILKSELNEVNILNAKLLYSNKIFKAKNLNESQKLKVLSSFDKAKNVGEVKLVFETLNEGLKKKTTSNSIKENLGSASKGTSTPKVKKPIVESSDVYLRMQKLAGII